MLSQMPKSSQMAQVNGFFWLLTPCFDGQTPIENPNKRRFSLLSPPHQSMRMRNSHPKTPKRVREREFSLTFFLTFSLFILTKKP